MADFSERDVAAKNCRSSQVSQVKKVRVARPCGEHLRQNAQGTQSQEEGFGAFEELPVMPEDGEHVAMGAWGPERDTALPPRCCRPHQGL